MTTGFAIEVQCTSGNKHGHEKFPCMLCYRLANALFFTWTMQHLNVVFQKSPQNCENVCEYKTYFTCVSNCCLFAHQLQLVLLDKH